MLMREALAIAGSLGYPSKMPGTSYGISAHGCITGAKLAKIEGSVCHGCYALKGNYQYSSVAKAHAKRLAGIASPLWTMAMVAMLNAAHSTNRVITTPGAKPNRHGNTRSKDKSVVTLAIGWHRWHDSGDLQSVEHLTKICAVAALTPQIRHWLPTRELGIVQQYAKQGGIVPDNLTIRVSATMIDGPATKAWSITSGVHSGKSRDILGRFMPHMAKTTHACPAPQQGNNCGTCRACWSRDVAHVSYHKH